MIRIGNKFSKLLAKCVALIVVVGCVSYPIIIDPFLDPTKYKNIQKVTRAGIDQEKIQPGNMKVWTDPFGRK